MPAIGKLRIAGLAKEPSVGTLTAPPTEFLRLIPPDSFYPKVEPLIEKAIGQLPDANLKQTLGVGTLNGMKLKTEAEPENIGHLLQACFGADALSGTAALGYTHTFTRQNVAQLPTYTWWFDKAPLYPQFVGCMLNKLDLMIKVKESVEIDTEWEGLSYDTTGITHSPSYSGARQFTFNMLAVSVDGSGILNYDNVKVSINNMVKADHALSASIYPAKIYSDGMDVEISADLFFEDATQYNKFLAGNTAHFILTLTHVDNIPSSSPPTPYTLVIDIPAVVYKSANLPITGSVMKIPFIGKAMYDTGTSKTISFALKNSVSSAY